MGLQWKALPAPNDRLRLMSPARAIFLSALSLSLGACSSIVVDRSPETGKTAVFDSKPVKVEEGIASWYHDRRTASGDTFSSTALTAAHKKLPFGSKVRVVDLKTHNSIIVRINDRGPYVRGRVIDLTTGAARQLGIYDRGLARVRLEVLREIPIMGKPNLRLSQLDKPQSTRKKKSSSSPSLVSR